MLTKPKELPASGQLQRLIDYFQTDRAELGIHPSLQVFKNSLKMKAVKYLLNHPLATTEEVARGINHSVISDTTKLLIEMREIKLVEKDISGWKINQQLLRRLYGKYILKEKLAGSPTKYVAPDYECEIVRHVPGSQIVQVPVGVIRNPWGKVPNTRLVTV